MKKKSLIFSDLSKRQLEKLKEFYIQRKVESMSNQELKQYVQEIISHQINRLRTHVSCFNPKFSKNNRSKDHNRHVNDNVCDELPWFVITHVCAIFVRTYQR